MKEHVRKELEDAINHFYALESDGWARWSQAEGEYMAAEIRQEVFCRSAARMALSELAQTLGFKVTPIWVEEQGRATAQFSHYKVEESAR